MSHNTPSEEKSTETMQDSVRRGMNWRLILSLVLIAIIIIFALMNAQTIRVNLLFATMETPLFVVIFGAAILGGITACLAVWQRSRRKTRR